MIHQPKDGQPRALHDQVDIGNGAVFIQWDAWDTKHIA